MTWISKSAPNDEAADASQFLSRLGYVVLALGVPAGVVLHPLAIFVLFPVGVALIVLRRAARSAGPVRRTAEPDLLSADRPDRARGHRLGGALDALDAFLDARRAARVEDPGLDARALARARRDARARARDRPLPVSLRPRARHGRDLRGLRRQAPGRWRSSRSGSGTAAVIATPLFPAMGGLAARGRNGWARLLLILAFVYAFAIGSTPTMIALFAGFAALSFAVSDLQRTARDLGWAAAGLVIAGSADRARRGAAGAADDARQAAGSARRPIPRSRWRFIWST